MYWSSRVKQPLQILENLADYIFRVPKGIVWIVEPAVAQWDEQRHFWSSRYIYNINFDREKETIEFKSLKFGIFSILLPKYSNLPFKEWRLMPSSTSTVTLRLKTALMTIEFTIKEDFVCISNIEDISKGPLHEIIGIDFKVRHLKRVSPKQYPKFINLFIFKKFC